MGLVEHATRPRRGLHRHRRPRRHFTLALVVGRSMLRPTIERRSPERRSVRRVTLAPHLEEHAMRWLWLSCLLMIGSALASEPAAQATGMPSYDAPCRAVSRSQVGSA